MTTLNLEADWSADVDSGGTKYPSDGFDSAGAVSGFGDLRIGLKWDITSLPASATLNQVDFGVEVIAVAGVSGDTWDIGPYDGDGQADPESDSGSTMFAACNVSADLYVDNTTALRTTGAKSFSDLGATAEADIAAARSAGVIFSMGIRMSTEPGSGNHYSALDEYDASNPATLDIDYTASAATGTATLEGASPTMSASGEQPHEGAATLALGAVTLDVAGAVPHESTGTFTVQSAQLDAIGLMHPDAVATLNLTDAQLDVTGAFGSTTGPADLALQAAQLDVAGTQPFDGAATLDLENAKLSVVAVMFPSGQASLLVPAAAFVNIVAIAYNQVLKSYTLVGVEPDGTIKGVEPAVTGTGVEATQSAKGAQPSHAGKGIAPSHSVTGKL